MNLHFTLRMSSHAYVRINSLKVKLKNGSTLTLDREITEWSKNDDGTISMTWRGVYLLAIDDCPLFGPKGYSIDDNEFMSSLSKIMKSMSFELEDDVDDDYSVEPLGFLY